MTLAFADDAEPPDLSRFGTVVERRSPKIKLQVERAKVAEVLAAVLNEHVVSDVSVEDPPLEEVIAGMFTQVKSAG